jgi:DNA-binding phage protein
MPSIAGDAGPGRRYSHRALAPGVTARFDTVFKVLDGLGVAITVLGA